MKFNGIYTPVITPLDDESGIDHDGFAAMVDYLVEQGMDGIVVGGTTGEYYAQTRDERVALMKLARDTMGKRAKLVVGAGALRTEDAVDYATEALRAGADAILVGSPYYALPTQQELAEHALEVDRAAGLPIMLYNYPGRTGVGMEAEFLDRVSESENFCAIKESSGDINRLHLLAQDYPHLQVSCGMDDQALEFFAWGATSWTCAGSNFLPAEHRALYEAVVLENDVAKGRRIMSAMLPLMRVLEQGGKFVQCVKYGCRIIGLPGGGVRKPLRWISAEEEAAMDAVVATLKEDVAAINGTAAAA